ncbi:serine/threonine-protein kinase [Nonomuraea sp. NPDC049480]|uniref:serine/threonine-protein kinase n=1 Tax=Nonomuraea sp. NPDC049480 TaxID=3364353 RepID=UPI00379FA178
MAFEVLQPDDPLQVGPYRIEARLGAGGMGRVYLGRSRTGRAVAVKVIHPAVAVDQDFLHRFAREVALARTVSGFFTAGVVDADPLGSPPWLATAYVPGLSLDAAVAEHGPWREPAVLALGAGLAEALESIHAAGVVHRDLKPSNVLLAADGPRVIDFGISMAIEGSRLTQTGMAVGTPGFMSPEQLTGAPVGPPSDIFCLGAVLAFAATGTGPFGTGSWQGLWYRTVHEEPDLAALSPALRAVVARCMAKGPEERPSATALLDELTESVARGTTIVELFTEVTWLPEKVAEAIPSAAPQPAQEPPKPEPEPPGPAPPEPAPPEPAPPAASPAQPTEVIERPDGGGTLAATPPAPFPRPAAAATDGHGQRAFYSLVLGLLVLLIVSVILVNKSATPNTSSPTSVAAPTPDKTSVHSGRFTSRISYCDLFKGQQILKLTQKKTRFGCRWAKSGVKLTVEPLLPDGTLKAPSPWFPSVAAAKDRYRRERESALNRWAPRSHTLPEDVIAGEAAFVYSDGGGWDAPSKATVVFRTSNLVLMVTYTDPDAGVSDVRNIAVDVTKAIASSLNKRTN